MTEYLPILAMGGFGVVLAIVSHFSLSRERKALLDARARLAEGEAAEAATDTKTASARKVSPAAMVRRADGGRSGPGAAKQYRRVRVKA